MSVAQASPAGTIVEYALPAGSTGPLLIAPGPDGNMWFTTFNGKIDTLVPGTGAMTELGAPSGGVANDITAGPDGNMWFTEPTADNVGRITTSGTITEFPVTASSSPVAITAGPDGNLWFPEQTANNIGQITTAGVAPSSPSPPRTAHPWRSRLDLTAPSGSPRKTATTSHG